MKTTETEFIKWIEDTKGIVINRTLPFSTMGHLGDQYKDAEGNSFFYGLCISGFPPNLGLPSNMFYHEYRDEERKKYLDKYFDNGNSGDYALFQNIFYTRDMTNEERYLILTKQKCLIATKEEAPI